MVKKESKRCQKKEVFMKRVFIAIIGLCALAFPAYGEDHKYSTLSIAERMAARQQARQAAYAQYAAQKQARIQGGCGGGSAIMAAPSYGCGGGTQMLYQGGGCNGATVQQGGGCCGGGATQQNFYMLPSTPIQAAPCAPAPTQTVQTSVPVQAPAQQTGASVNVQYYLPPPQIQGTQTTMNPPVQTAAPCPECGPGGTYSGSPKKQQRPSNSYYVRQEWRPNK
jgi:hypothetical protein